MGGRLGKTRKEGQDRKGSGSPYLSERGCTPHGMPSCFPYTTAVFFNRASAEPEFRQWYPRVPWDRRRSVLFSQCPRSGLSFWTLIVITCNILTFHSVQCQSRVLGSTYVQKYCCSTAHFHRCLHAASVGHLKPDAFFFYVTDRQTDTNSVKFR